MASQRSLAQERTIAKRKAILQRLYAQNYPTKEQILERAKFDV